MRYWSNNREPTPGISKADLYDPGANTGAIADADDWIDEADGNAAPSVGYNAALSDPFKSNATADMKSLLFCVVASVRCDDTGDMARRILQVEVD
jgi:hypothetical protein